MIYQCRKVLKSVNYLCIRQTKTSSADIVLYYKNHVNRLDLENTLQYLVDTGYIKAKFHDNYVDEIELTYKGKHYKSFAFEWFRNSVLFPILISVVTAFVTSFITNLLT